MGDKGALLLAGGWCCHPRPLAPGVNQSGAG